MVVRNILSLGSKVKYIFTLGDDENSKYYKSFNHKNLQKFIINDSLKKTTAKKRFWIDGYKLLQIDDLDNQDISKEIENKILNTFKEHIKSCDLVIISDYRHGLLTESLIASIKIISNIQNKKLFVDSQISHRVSNHHLYKDIYMLFLSENEAKNIDPNFDADKKLFNKILNSFPNIKICIKLGENGSVYLNDKEVIFSPAADVKVNDTCGAGDAFLAACAVGHIDDPIKLMELANAWAGLSTQIHGTQPPELNDLLKKI